MINTLILLSLLLINQLAVGINFWSSTLWFGLNKQSLGAMSFMLAMLSYETAMFVALRLLGIIS